MKRSFGLGEGNMDGGAVSMADLLMLLSRRAVVEGGSGGAEECDDSQRVFECKTCSRRFPSFQALGGHRASHKKPRGEGGCETPPPKPPRVHECSICGVEFAIGQALGGHMRRHRAAAAAGGLAVRGLAGAAEEKKKNGGLVLLDLNLPPVENDLKLGLGLMETMENKIRVVNYCLY